MKGILETVVIQLSNGDVNYQVKSQVCMHNIYS